MESSVLIEDVCLLSLEQCFNGNVVTSLTAIYLNIFHDSSEDTLKIKHMLSPIFNNLNAIPCVIFPANFIHI